MISICLIFLKLHCDLDKKEFKIETETSYKVLFNWQESLLWVVIIAAVWQNTITEFYFFKEEFQIIITEYPAIFPN